MGGASRVNREAPARIGVGLEVKFPGLLGGDWQRSSLPRHDRDVHRLEMVYRPWTARPGGLMTLLGIAGPIALWLTVKR
jgi:hypothetical protein